MTQTQIQDVTTVSVQPAQVVKRTSVVTQQAHSGSPQKEYQAKKVIFRTHQIIWYLLGVVEVLLLFRIILKVKGANPFSGFANFIFALSSLLRRHFSVLLRHQILGVQPQNGRHL